MSVAVTAILNEADLFLLVQQNHMTLKEFGFDKARPKAM